MSATTEARLEAYLQAIEEKDLDAVFALVAEDAVFDDCNGEVTRGKPALREMAASLFSGIPDNQIVRRINLVTSDRVAIAEFESSGTHTGTYVGFPPTGKTITWRFASIYEWDDDGLLTRQGYYYDTAGLAAKLSGEADG